MGVSANFASDAAAAIGAKIVSLSSSSERRRPSRRFRQHSQGDTKASDSPMSGASRLASRLAEPHTCHMSDDRSLANHLLVAMPSLADPEFAQSVTLVCEHSAERGALGIVINKPLPMTLAEVFEQMDLESADSKLGGRPVLRGGPVNRDRGFVVHRPEGEWDSSHQIAEGIQITTSKDVLAAMARGEGPRDAFVALGYAGWSPGQLEQEMKDNAWITLPVDERILFEMPLEDRWHAVWRQLGVDPVRMSHVAGHA